MRTTREWRGWLPGLVLALALGPLACSPGSTTGGPGTTGGDGGSSADGAAPLEPDADGDGISDRLEGAAEGVDTDGDGIPDYQDGDSDGDGKLDRIEGRTAYSGQEPVDSDGDGTPDFRDLDSDDNGIPDADEPDDDSDGDGLPDFQDGDDDGDGIADGDEIGDDPASPVDSDGDGLPDYRDIDSDNDFITDRYEYVDDTDGDGTPDRFDGDSDGDGIPDLMEAGDSDLDTPPVDTDGDGIPDFRDPDSDGDGLGDGRARELGTDPRSADTDGAGVSDLIEVSACPEGDASCASDATDPGSSPRTRGDFVFAEPYMMPPTPERDTLDFATDIRKADVYFLIDTTGSMGTAIGNVRRTLSTDIIPAIRAEIPDVEVGVGDFQDYCYGGYGGSGDYPYRHGQDISPDVSRSQSAVNGLRASGGWDGPESYVPALYATATGSGLSTCGPRARMDCPAGRWGYPCFRDGAVPIVVLIGDNEFHNGPGGAYPYSGIPGAPSYAATVAALRERNVRVISVWTSGTGAAHIRQLATDTGAVDGSGNPLVTTGTGGTVGRNVVDQIRILANQTRFDISVRFDDDPSDMVDTFAAFVDRIEANEAGDAARGCEALPAVDSDGDGVKDTFPDVTAGTRVCFDIVVKENTTVEPTADPQVFKATLTVLGDGFTELDARDVFFLVPGEVEIGPPTIE